MELELAGFSSRYGPEWPAVKQLNTEVGELRLQLQMERRQALQSVRQDFEVAQRRHATLQAAVDEQRDLVEQLDDDSIQYNILRREVESNKELYEGLLQRLKETGVASGLAASNIRMAEEALAPGGAASPQKTRALLLALIVGLFLGVAAVVLAEALDNTIQSAEDIDRLLGFPALGVVPDLARRKPSVAEGLFGNLFRKRKIERTGPKVVDLDSSEGFRALEAFRSLRTSLMLSHAGKPPQVVLVTSAMPAEGKSTTATNTALVLAQTGARTLLVDCDIRRPSPLGSVRRSVLDRHDDIPGGKFEVRVAGSGNAASEPLRRRRRAARTESDRTPGVEPHARGPQVDARAFRLRRDRQPARCWRSATRWCSPSMWTVCCW